MDTDTTLGLTVGLLFVIFAGAILVYATATGNMFFNGRFNGFARKDHPRLFVIEYLFWMVAGALGAWMLWVLWPTQQFKL